MSKQHPMQLVLNHFWFGRVECGNYLTQMQGSWKVQLRQKFKNMRRPTKRSRVERDGEQSSDVTPGDSPSRSVSPMGKKREKGADSQPEHVSVDLSEEPDHSYERLFKR